MRRDRLRLAAGIVAMAATLAVVLTLTLGGSDESTIVSGRALSQAAERTTEQETSHIVFTGAVTIEVNGESAELGMFGEGDQDLAKQRGTLNMTVTLPDELSDQVGTDEIEMEEIFDDLSVYMRSSIFDQAMPSGKEWLLIDIADAGRRMGIDFQSLMGGNMSDPAQMLDQLRAVSSEVEDLGSEEIDGVDTTHYRATIDYDRYVKLVKPAERARARTSIENLKAMLGSDEEEVEVWVDSDHLVRRIAETFDYSVPDGGDVAMSMQIGFTDFGKEVDVEIPPADDVLDASDLPGYTNGLQQY